MLTLLWQRTCGYMCFHTLVFVCVVCPRTSASVPLCIFLHDFCRRSLSLYLSFVLYMSLYNFCACLCWLCLYLSPDIHPCNGFAYTYFLSVYLLSVFMYVCPSVFVVVFFLLSLLLLLSMLPPRAPARTSQWPPPRYHIKTLGTKP